MSARRLTKLGRRWCVEADAAIIGTLTILNRTPARTDERADAP